MPQSVFGELAHLTLPQACARASIIFVVTLVVIRMSGRRSLGQRSPFDQVVVILLGSMLSRVIVGVSPMGPTIGGAIIVVTLHRLFALLARRYEWFDALMNGRERVVARNGTMDAAEMRNGLLSERDLTESARQHGQPHWRHFDLQVMERNGSISMIRKQSPPSESVSSCSVKQHDDADNCATTGKYNMNGMRPRLRHSQRRPRRGPRIHPRQGT